jgi:hypothetical protein
VYTWIWRRLPGGLPGKLVGSLLLVTAAVLLLFFVVFPAVEPLLPFNDVTVEQDDDAAQRTSAGEEPAPGRALGDL